MRRSRRPRHPRARKARKARRGPDASGDRRGVRAGLEPEEVARILKIIVGLGNPGEEYSSSRHNIGFQVLDCYAEMEGFPPARKKRRVDYSETRIGGDRVLLVRPRTYMNLSGVVVQEFLSDLPIWKEVMGARDSSGGRPGPSCAEADCGFRSRLLVVHDDLDLPFGKLRYRDGGSSGGHRGIASVIQALGTQLFDRLKVGIGRREGADAAEYVLETLRGEQKRVYLEAAKHAAKTLPTWLERGIDACANRFNGPEGEYRC